MFGATGVAGTQTAHQFALDPDRVLAVAGTQRPSDLRPGHVREVPELTVNHLDELFEGDVTVLGHLLETALTEDCRLWLTHVTHDRLAELEAVFGPNLVHVVGAEQGGRIPVALSPQRVVETWSLDPERRQLLRGWLDGLDAVRLPHRIVRALDAAGVHFVHHGWFARAARNPTVLAYVVVLLYSAFRALPVSFVKQFHGNLVTLWAIDLITAIPYTWGVLAMVTAKRFSKRLAGTVVTVVTFVAPYVYFWMHGRHYPPGVIVIIIALVLGGLLLEAWKISRDRLIRRELAEAHPHAPAASARR